MATTIDITTKGSPTSRHARFTVASICKFNVFANMHWSVSGKSTQSDLFVNDHGRHLFPTRSGPLDRSHPNKFPPHSCRHSQFHKQKCLNGIDTFRVNKSCTRPPLPAPRPSNSIMCVDKFEGIFSITCPYWRTNYRSVMSKIFAEHLHDG